MRPSQKDIDNYAALGRELLLVSAVRPGDGVTAPLRIVLCKVESPTKYPYVIWWENMADSVRVGHPATFGGDYHEGSLSALATFRELAEKNQLILND
jgi:hypothetical protein